MTAADLLSRSDCSVLDVRLPEDYEAAHVKGALNNCVYEVAFLSRMEDSGLDKNATLVVCGPDAGCASAATAKEKLSAMGYTDVRELDGGFHAAEESGLEIVRGDPASPGPKVRDGKHVVQPEESVVRWVGRNLLKQHTGTVAVSSGELTVSEGRLVSGHIALDLTKITSHDLEGSERHDVLIHHLESDDFFDVKHHPEAVLEIVRVEDITGCTPGLPNLRIHATLELRGVRQDLAFDVVSGFTDEGKLAGQTTFAIDRTLWNVRYGSGKWYHRLGAHLVNDLIELQVKIVAAA